jgi:hypothetical protein
MQGQVASTPRILHSGDTADQDWSQEMVQNSSQKVASQSHKGEPSSIHSNF